MAANVLSVKWEEKWVKNTVYATGLGVHLGWGAVAAADKAGQSIQPGFRSMSSYSRLGRGRLGGQRRASQRVLAPSRRGTRCGCDNSASRWLRGPVREEKDGGLQRACPLQPWMPAAVRQGLSLPPLDVPACSGLALAVSSSHTHPVCRGGDQGGSFCSLAQPRLDVFCPWVLPETSVWIALVCP